jgi:hypothetical protein
LAENELFQRMAIEEEEENELSHGDHE